MLGAALTSWTIRLALVAYVAVLVGWLRGTPVSEPFSRRLRWLWTVGCALFVAHVASAFQFYHHWSHEHALADTASQTKELIGWAFGEGLYFSYLFLVVWLADVAWWWLSERTYLARPAWMGGLVHVYLLFIALNGAIVFKEGATRYAGLLSLVVLSVLVANRTLAGASQRSYTNSSLAERWP